MSAERKFGHSAMWTSVFRKSTDGFLLILAQFSRSTVQNAALISAILRAYFAASVNMAFVCAIFFFFFHSLFLFVSFTIFTRFGAPVLYFCVALVVGVALRLSGVLLRVALKHRGSVAAGSRCGLWPADSVGCGDCGLAASVVGGTRGSSVGTFASPTAPTRCRETRRLAAAAFCRGAARLAYLSARAHPPE